MGFEIINKLKKEKGLTNSQIAKKAGITVSTLDKITAGINTNPKLDTLQAICRVLGCRLDDFDDNKSHTPKREADYNELKLLEEYNKLNDIGRAEAVKRVSELAQIPKYQSGLSEVRAIARSGYTETTSLTAEEEKELERLTAELDEKLKDEECDL